jgi:uncharacterized protein involved in exopolysaccharide biosynthesis
MNNLMIYDDNEDRTRTWVDAARALRKNKWLVLLVFVATVAAAFGTLQFLSEKYESESSLLVKLGRENSEIPSTVQKGSLLTTGVRKEELNSIVQMLTSRNLVEATVDEIGLEAFRFEPVRPHGFLPSVKYYAKLTARAAKRKYEGFLIAVNLQKELSEREKVVLGIEGALQVEPHKESDVLMVRMRLPDPALCVRVSEVLLKKYLDKHNEIRRSDNASDFLNQQVASTKSELLGLEREKSGLRDKWNLSSPAEQRTILLKRLSELTDQINSSQGEKVMLERQQAQFRASLASIPETLRKSEVTTPNPSVQSLKDRITTLKLERTRMASNYKSNSPSIQKLDEEISALDKMLTNESATQIGSSTSEINPLRQTFIQNIEEITAKIAGLNAKINELRKPAAEIQGQLAMVDTGESRLNGVERERRIAEQNYLDYSKRKEEAYTADLLDQRHIPNVVILSAPSMPIEPVYPRKLLIMGIVLPFGLILGISLALLLEYVSDRIETERDINSIEGMNFLGTVRLMASE